MRIAAPTIPTHIRIPLLRRARYPLPNEAVIIVFSTRFVFPSLRLIQWHASAYDTPERKQYIQALYNVILRENF